MSYRKIEIKKKKKKDSTNCLSILKINLYKSKTFHQNKHFDL